jgi:nicotinamide-nucleotide amidase
MQLATVEPLVLRLADALRARHWWLASAESCTGGLIAAACTSVAGSSEWFERGFVTYSNAAKTELLGVPPALIAAHGAVSEQVARAMADGVLAHAPVHLALSVTGVAGPGGGTPDKPVGLVWLGWSRREGGGGARRLDLSGDRTAIRAQTVEIALKQALRLVEP